MYRSHNPSYLKFLRISAERDADPGSVAVRANAEGEKESTQVEFKIRHFFLREGEHSHAIRTLTISTIKANRFKNCIEASR